MTPTKNKTVLNILSNADEASRKLLLNPTRHGKISKIRHFLHLYMCRPTLLIGYL